MAETVSVSILTGFLGAGKTTLLNRLLKAPAMANTAVIINEFGDVALDHLLVDQGDDDIIELSSGCLCCTIRGELVETLERLLERAGEQSLSSILIETTGLADPVPVMQAVMAHPVLKDRLTLGAVVTVVDAVNGLATLDTHGEALRQVAVSDHVLLSKADISEDVSAIVERVSAINPIVSVERVDTLDLSDLLTCFSGSVFDLATRSEAVRAWFDPHVDNHHHHAHGHVHHHHDTSRHGASIQSFSLVRDEPIGRRALDGFLELLASAHGPKLLRVKGLIYVADHPKQPLVIHGVQRVFHEPILMDAWPDGARTTRIVFIVDGLGNAFVSRLFDGFNGKSQLDQANRAALTEDPLVIAGFTPGRKL